MSEGYITDFHNGERKFVKGRLRKDRPLDSFDFHKTKEHNINTKFLEENKDVIIIKNSTYPWPIKKHVKFSLKTLKTHFSRIKRKTTNEKKWGRRHIAKQKRILKMYKLISNHPEFDAKEYMRLRIKELEKSKRRK